MRLDDLFACHVDRGAGPTPFDRTRFPTHGGIFAFTDLNRTLVQLAHGVNLRRLIVSRLRPPAERGGRRTDLLAITQRVWWEPTHSPFETALKFHERAYRLCPGQHREMCRFGAAWFAVIDLHEAFPRWLASSDPFLGNSACVGPFGRRRDCERFVKGVEDLFALCRYHHILQQAPNGQACAYFDMGRCPAPCDGTIPLERYRDVLRESVGMVQGREEGLLVRLQSDMAEASAELDFELAERFKQHRRLAGELLQAVETLHRRREDFRYVIVQPAAARDTVKAFLVNQGDIRATPAVAGAELDSALSRWLGCLEGIAEPEVPDRTYAVERMWLVCHFLQRDRLPGVVLKHPEPAGGGAAAAERIRQQLGLGRGAGAGETS